MDLTIDDLYITFLSCDRNKKRLLQYTKMSRATINKYIDIKERLDPELFRELGKKVKIGIAFFLCTWVRNMEAQVTIYSRIKNMKLPEQKQEVMKETTCVICCSSSKINKEYMPCCRNSICSECMIEIIKEATTGVCFQLVKCPFCREILPFSFLYDIYTLEESWRKWNSYRKHTIRNSGKIYLNMIHKITNTSEYPPTIETLQGIEEKMSSSHYGHCHKCISRVYVDDRYFKKELIRHPIYLKNIGVGEIQKQCINVDLTIKPDMFTCLLCKDMEENVIIKKCPHCGIKTLQPDGCNYVRCECGNRWCFVCNLRLPNSHEGHNVHYWVGSTSSAYDHACRVSENHYGDKHLINKCDCEYCKPRYGRALCSNINCSRTVPIKHDFNTLCYICKKKE